MSDSVQIWQRVVKCTEGINELLSKLDKFLSNCVFPLLTGGKYQMGQFAIVGFLIILIDFIPLLFGLSLSKGSFKSKSIKISLPIWFIMLVIGAILIMIL